MNFDDAIKAHVAWKIKLSSYIKNPDHSLLHNEVCKDNNCELGKWIYGEGSKFSKLPEYNVLKMEHIRFHKAASEIVKKADNGGNASEEVALGAKSDFADASNKVVTAIMQMKRVA